MIYFYLIYYIINPNWECVSYNIFKRRTYENNSIYSQRGFIRIQVRSITGRACGRWSFQKRLRLIP